VACDGSALEPELVEERDEVVGEVVVAVRRRMGAEPVAAQVGRDDAQPSSSGATRSQ